MSKGRRGRLGSWESSSLEDPWVWFLGSVQGLGLDGALRAPCIGNPWVRSWPQART